MTIKEKIIDCLDNERVLQNMILKTLPSHRDILADFLPTMYKAHWIYKYIDEIITFDLFIDTDGDVLDDEALKIILHTIIQTVGQFQFYTLSDAYANENKNKPSNQRNKDLKTIQNFTELLNNLGLGGKIKMYEEEKEYYNVNTDKSVILDISHVKMFLDHLKSEIKAVNGNNKTTFGEPYRLGIKYKYHNPKVEGLNKKLKEQLKPYINCSQEDFNSSIDYLVNDFLQENKNLIF